MSHCLVDAVSWNEREAYRLSNGTVELTALLGGGHLADFRLSESLINVLWQSPWPTIDPQTFSSRQHATLYGEGPVGRFLSGYTGHALALGYFGMPSSEEAANGMSLHGEAASSRWEVVAPSADDDSATLAMEVTLPVYRLRFRREISLARENFTARITETVTNLADTAAEFQWVQHASFGEPFFTNGEATLFVSGKRGVTWPAGYEGHEILANGLAYQWPYAQAIEGGLVDLSQPFVHDGTGFVAALLCDSDHENAFVAVHNRRHHLVAGYCFDPSIFPWVALWEENRARANSPWNKRTRVRGVEFGTSPMPLGLAHARESRRLFDTPVLCSIAANAYLETQYDLFVHPVPPQWSQINDVWQREQTLVVRGGNDRGDDEPEITIQRGRPRL